MHFFYLSFFALNGSLRTALLSWVIEGIPERTEDFFLDHDEIAHRKYALRFTWRNTPRVNDPLSMLLTPKYANHP